MSDQELEPQAIEELEGQAAEVDTEEVSTDSVVSEDAERLLKMQQPRKPRPSIPSKNSAPSCVVSPVTGTSSTPTQVTKTASR